MTIIHHTASCLSPKREGRSAPAILSELLLILRAYCMSQVKMLPSAAFTMFAMSVVLFADHADQGPDGVLSAAPLITSHHWPTLVLLSVRMQDRGSIVQFSAHGLPLWRIPPYLGVGV